MQMWPQEGVGGPRSPIHHMAGDVGLGNVSNPTFPSTGLSQESDQQNRVGSTKQSADTLSRTAEITDVRQKKVKHPEKGILNIVHKEKAALCRVTKYWHFS